MDFLLNILSHWESALAVLLVLGGLIFFHELGHFAVARLFRIGVRTFSLGFGPKLLQLRRGKPDIALPDPRRLRAALPGRGRSRTARS